MSHDDFYRRFAAIAALPPAERFAAMAEFHSAYARPYLATLRAITPEGAARPVPDGRTVAQVVAHIAEWDRNMLTALGEILAGVRFPRFYSRNYIEADGSTHSFPTIDAFNAYAAQRHSATPWPELQAFAVDVAETLNRLMTASGLLTPERLETTRPLPATLPDGTKLTLPCGWLIWLTVIEHEGIEHDADLAIGAGTDGAGE